MRHSGSAIRASTSIAVAGAQVSSTPSVSRAVLLSHTSRFRTMRQWPTPTAATGPTCNKGASGGAAQTVQNLPCGLGPSDLWLVLAPSLIVRAATKRRQCRRNTGAVHLNLWYRHCCPLLCRCCWHRSDQARKEASQEPAHSISACRSAHAFPFSKPTGCKILTAWVVRSADRQGTAPSIA